MTSPDPNPAAGPGPDPLHERLNRVEESLAFAQHEVDALRDEAASLRKALRELQRRVETLERRQAAGTQNADTDPDPP